MGTSGSASWPAARNILFWFGAGLTIVASVTLITLLMTVYDAGSSWWVFILFYLACPLVYLLAWLLPGVPIPRVFIVFFFCIGALAAAQPGIGISVIYLPSLIALIFGTPARYSSPGPDTQDSHAP